MFEPGKPIVTLTDAAATQVRALMDAADNDIIGLRIGIKTAGCSGLAYKLEFVDNAPESDCSYENHGVTVFVDAKSLVYLKGTTLDFVKEGLNEGFKFVNPNVTGECGCGESFQV